MIDEHLGDDYASDKRARLRQLAAVVEHEQEEVVSAFQSKRSTPDEYLERFTRLAGDLFASYERVLGRDDFVRLFGVPPSTRSISSTLRSLGKLTAPEISTPSPIEVASPFLQLTVGEG